ncbi:MAG: hypothetical protein ABF382_13780 [Akkermansiaceae bacterium]
MKSFLPISALLAPLFMTLVTSCSDSESAEEKSSVETSVYGSIPDAGEVKIFTLTNANGMTAKVTEYGAILVSVTSADKDGKQADLTHSYDNLEGWLTNTSYFGSTVGRFGNRIADGKFTLEGKEYQLATNNDPGGIPCHLPGGLKGFDKVLWKVEPFQKEGSRGVKFSYVSVDGEEGYPRCFREFIY